MLKIKTIYQTSLQDKIKLLLIVAGSIEVFVALLHFFIPYFIYQSNGFINLNKIESDYVLLVTYAVGILLIAFGTTTILLSTQINIIKKILFYYVLIQIVLWTTRILLEMLYPVRLNIFYIEPFTTVILPGLLIELSLFIMAIFFINKLIKTYKQGE